MTPRHLFAGEPGDRRCSAPDGDGICNLLEEEHPEPVAVATIETEHFTFDGVGHDEEEARSALLDALLAHGNEYADAIRQAGHTPALWFEPYMDSVRVRELWPGAGYRDGEEVA